ncbi:MAG: tetratricopeptide repeat protein [Pseudomonadota bacterium]
MLPPLFAMLTLSLAMPPAIDLSTGGPAASSDQRRHENCVRQIPDAPTQAYEAGLAWTSQGGGWPARHCAALALVALGHPGEAATRLEDLGRTIEGASPRSRAIMLGQAADAWLEAGEPTRAAAAFTAGLEQDPGDYGLAAGRAEALLAAGDLDAAHIAATQAIALNGQPAEAWRLRAEALLALDDLDGALGDMQAARERAPDDVEILLLRGRINEALRLSR